MKPFVLLSARDVPSAFDSLRVSNNFALCTVSSHVEKIAFTHEERSFAEPNQSSEPFNITGIDTITAYPFAYITEIGNGKLRDFKFQMTKVSDPVAPWHGSLIAVLQSNFRISILNEKLEVVATVDDILAAYVDQKIATNPNTSLRYLEGPALNFPPGKKFPNEHFIVALREMQTLCVAWSRPLVSNSPDSASVILAVGGQGLFVTLFAIEITRSNISSISSKVRLIARLPHDTNEFVRSISFGALASDNSTQLAVGLSSGRIKEFRLRFEIREKGVACVLDGQRESFPEDQLPITVLEFHPRDDSLLLMVKNMIVTVTSNRNGVLSKAAICAHNTSITSALWLDISSKSAEEGDAMDIDESSTSLQYFLTSSMDGTLKLWSYNGKEILFAKQFDLKGAHNFKPLYGAAASPNGIYALFLAWYRIHYYFFIISKRLADSSLSNREKLSLDVASPMESHPRLGLAPLDLVSVESMINCILLRNGDEIVDWDLRRYLQSSREPEQLFQKVFQHLLSELDSSSPQVQLRASKLLLGLIQFWQSSFRSASENPFEQVFSQRNRALTLARVDYALDCLGAFIVLRQNAYEHSDKESQALWNLYQDAKMLTAHFSSENTTELFAAVATKMDAYGPLIFASAREKALKYQCSLCSVNVDLASSYCEHGHPIAICARTLTLIPDAIMLRCVGCNSPSLPISLRSYPWQRLHSELCPYCGHRFRSSVL